MFLCFRVIYPQNNREHGLLCVLGTMHVELLSVVYLYLFLTLHCDVVNSKKEATFNIGGLFDKSKPEQKEAFLTAVKLTNRKFSHLPFGLKGHTFLHDNKDVLSLTKETCKFIGRGVRVLVGPNSNTISRHIGSVISSKDIIHIETRHYSEQEEHNYFKVNLHPHPSIVGKMFADILSWLSWGKFTIIYDDNDSLSKLHQLLAYKSSKYDVKVTQLMLDKSNTYRSLLHETKNSGEKHFVVVCSLETLRIFMQQAQQVGLLSERHHYVIYNFDMHNIDIEQYQYAGCHIFSVRFVNPADRKVQQGIELIHEKLNSTENGYEFHKNQNTLNLETALVMDAVELIHKNLREYSHFITNQRLTCNHTDSWWYGTSFLNNMYMQTIAGYTGQVNLDTQGYRSQFVAEILELTTKGLERRGIWNSTLIPDPPPEVPKQTGELKLEGGHFNVIAVLTPPYGTLKNTTKPQSGNDRYEGYGFDLIQKLSEMLKFNYTIYIQEGQNNGNYDNKTQRWNGMMGRIMYDDKDPIMHFAIGDLTVTSAREKAVDFTFPFMTLGISILYKKPEPAPPSLFMFASPFSPKVWLLLFIAYIFVSVSLFVLGRLSPSEWQNPYPCIEEPEFLINQFTFKNSFWFTVGSLMQQGTELAPIGVSTRMVAGVWWFFTLIMVSSYTANLAAFLTVTTLQTPFENIRQLTQQTEIKYGAKRGGATESFFAISDRPDYRAVWKYMLANPSVRVDSNDVGVEMVLKQNYAFLMESTSIEYVIERKCSLGKVGDSLDEKGYAIAMRKNSTYRAKFNKAILKLQENGWLNQLKLKWWKEKLGGGTCQTKSSAADVDPLGLSNVGGVFLVLMVGTLVGILIAFLELTFDIFAYIKTENVKYKEEMIEEMKFFLKFKKNVKPARKCEKQSDREPTDFTFNNINYLENYINENNQNS